MESLGPLSLTRRKLKRIVSQVEHPSKGRKVLETNLYPWPGDLVGKKKNTVILRFLLSSIINYKLIVTHGKHSNKKTGELAPHGRIMSFKHFSKEEQESCEIAAQINAWLDGFDVGQQAEA